MIIDQKVAILKLKESFLMCCVDSISIRKQIKILKRLVFPLKQKICETYPLWKTFSESALVENCLAMKFPTILWVALPPIY